MGEREKKQDLDWMIKLCEPTESHHLKLLDSPFAREFDTFNESLFMSSLGPTQTQTQQPDNPTQQSDPNHIIMLSLPATQTQTNDEDDAVFVTPPENQFRSSSDYSDKRKRVSDDDEAESKKIKVSQSSSSQVQCTQPVVVETRGSKESVVYVLDGDSGNETDRLGDDCVGITRNLEDLSQDRGVKVGLDSRKTGKRVVSLGVNVASVEITRNVEECSQDRSFKEGLGGSSKIVKRGESVVSLGDKVASVVGNDKACEKIVETRVESTVCVVEKVVNVVGNGRVDKDVGAGTSCNGFEEIDKFAYNSNGDANKQQGKRKLPDTIQGDDKDNNDVVEKEKEIDFYDVLKMLESAVGDGEEVDFLETAKKRGIVFPRPRWWHPDW